MASFSSLRRHRMLSARACGSFGLTLVELLAGLVIATVVAAAAGSVLLEQVRSSGSLELAQRQRDNSSRFDYLIQIEAAEAASISKNETLPAACSGGGSAVVAYKIPRNQGQYLDASNASFIYYYNKLGDIWRCGPPVKRSGVLDHDSAKPLQAGIAVRAASLEDVSCNGNVTDSSQFAYQLAFPNGYKSSCSVARAKTLLICNAGDPCIDEAASN